ncbi:MAG: AAA family ATPase [Dehalococcoidia bacterium]
MQPSQAHPIIVAISRQMGSGAHAVARIVATKLDLPLLDQEIINRAAVAAGVEPDVIVAAESVPSLITRIVEQLGRYPVALEPDGLSAASLPANLMLTSSDYRYLIDRVVQQVADQQSAVIFGHGAAQTLADHPGVLRVFILAPLDLRVRRHAHDQGLSDQQARQQVRENDRERAEFFRHYYDMDWLDARRYDLLINAGGLSDQLAADLVVRAAQSRIEGAFAEPAASTQS